VVTSPVELIYRILSIELIYRILSALAILVGTYLVGGAIQRVLREALRKAGIPRAEVLVVSASAKYIMVFLGLLAALDTLAIPIAPFIGAFGILALIIGLASRNMIESIISGFILTTSRPFEIGDLIMVKEMVGEVMEFDLMKTSLKTDEGVVYVIPNSTILNSGLNNLTALGSRFKVDLRIRVSYDSDLEQTRLSILDVVNAYPMLSRDQPVSIDIESMGDKGICLDIGFFVPHLSLRKQAASKVLEGLLQAHREGKINLTYEGALSIA